MRWKKNHESKISLRVTICTSVIYLVLQTTIIVVVLCSKKGNLLIMANIVVNKANCDILDVRDEQSENPIVLGNPLAK